MLLIITVTSLLKAGDLYTVVNNSQTGHQETEREMICPKIDKKSRAYP